MFDVTFDTVLRSILCHYFFIFALLFRCFLKCSLFNFLMLLKEIPLLMFFRIFFFRNVALLPHKNSVFNPLSTNSTRWSNKFKLFVDAAEVCFRMHGFWKHVSGLRKHAYRRYPHLSELNFFSLE